MSAYKKFVKLKYYNIWCFDQYTEGKKTKIA